MEQPTLTETPEVAINKNESTDIFIGGLNEHNSNNADTQGINIDVVPVNTDESRKNETEINSDNKKKITLNSNSFYGIPSHKDVLNQLLNEIQPVMFRDIINLGPDEHLKQKHILFAVVKELLRVAKAREWNLCQAFDYYTYIYNGAYWKQCSKDEIKFFLSNAAIKMSFPDYEAKHYEFTEKLLKQFLSDAHFSLREKDSSKVLINLLNGTFEFTNNGWEKRDFSPDDFLTYQLPFDYDKNASCPLFDKFLLHVLPDKSSRMVLQEFAGYIFTNLNLEKCLILIGEGGNGKSVFMNILCSLIGKENTLNYSMGLFSHEYNRAKLSNILLNYSSEKGFDLQPDIFKALVSGEGLQAREIYQKPFTLLNNAKFISNANKLPTETESTEAYYRRIILVPFDVKISEEEKDISLAEKIITNELPGVFNWLLEGLKRIIEQKRFSNCEQSERALGEFRKQGDNVQLFIEEKGYHAAETDRVALSDLYTYYKDFCKDDGYKPKGKNNFSKELERKGFEKTRLNNGTSAFFIDKNESNV